MTALVSKLLVPFRNRTSIIRLFLSIAILASLFSFVDLGKTFQAFRELGMPSLLGCFGLLLVSQHLSSVRFAYLLADNGFKVPLQEVYRANIFGLIGGMFFFNIFGQGITRSVLLNQYRVPQSTIFFLTLLERASALLVLFTAAVISAAVLFGRIPLSFDNETLFLAYFAAYGIVAAVSVLAIGLSRRQRAQLLLFFRNLMSASMMRLLFVTLLMHAAMLASYVIIAFNIAPVVRVGESTAASIIVMLVASLPISFAGWGFRELSASLAYAKIGATPEQGFAIGLVIGTLSILALIANAAWLNWGPQRQAFSPSRSATGGFADPAILERPTYWLIGLGTAFAVFFNVRVPTNSGELTVNLGDPIAIIAGIVAIGLMLQLRSVSRLWRVEHFSAATLAISLVLAAGLLHSYVLYGPIDWAIYNRFFGWFLLLAYVASGTLVVAVGGNLGFGTLCKVLIASAAGLAVVEYVRRFFVGLNASGGLWFRSEGMANNSNAFALQLLVAMVVLVGTKWFRNSKRVLSTPTLVGAVLLVGLWLAGSRAAIAALAVGLAAVLVSGLRVLDYRNFLAKLGAAAGIAAVIILAIPKVATVGVAIGSSDVEPDRLASVLEGIAMWRDHPLIGAGLGAFIHEHVVQTGIPLVIHNSALWIAAELGFPGLIAFGALFFIIAMNAIKSLRGDTSEPQIVLLGCLVAVAAMSMLHDMLYQRLLWLVIGAAIAAPRSLRSILRSGHGAA